jgi:hypothetical protein
VKLMWFKWNTNGDVELHSFYLVRLLHIRQVIMEVVVLYGIFRKMHCVMLIVDPGSCSTGWVVLRSRSVSGGI